MKAFTFSFLFLFLSCFQIKRQPTDEDKARVYNKIEEYIEKVSKYKEYQEINVQFNCFYDNAVKAGRQNFLQVDTGIGEAILGLDSLMVFTLNRDSALISYITKYHNYESDGYHYAVSTLLAYKNNQKWRFKDQCATAYYPERYYTLKQAVKNERLFYVFENFANKIHWFEKWWSDDDIYENYNFVHNMANVECGLCDKVSWSEDPDFCQQIEQKNTPPDSLYNCE